MYVGYPWLHIGFSSHWSLTPATTCNSPHKSCQEEKQMETDGHADCLWLFAVLTFLMLESWQTSSFFADCLSLIQRSPWPIMAHHGPTLVAGTRARRGQCRSWWIQPFGIWCWHKPRRRFLGRIEEFLDQAINPKNSGNDGAGTPMFESTKYIKIYLLTVFLCFFTY